MSSPHIYLFIYLSIYLREFVLTTVIMAPSACRTQGRSCPGGLHFEKFDNEGQNSRSISLMYKNSGFGTVWRETDHQHLSILDFQSLIYLQAEHVCLSTYSEFDFYGRINLTGGRWTGTKVHKIFRPSPRRPQRARVGPKDFPRPLQETDSIHSNSRSTAKRS